MADYYTHASVLLKLPKEALDFAEKLFDAQLVAFMQGLEFVNADYYGIIKEYFCHEHSNGTEIDVLRLGCLKNRESDTELHLYDDETAEPYQLAVFIQIVLKKFDLPDKIGFHFANTCNKPLTDAYGGGCYFVTKDNIKWWSSYDALDQFEKESSKEEQKKHTCRLILGSKQDGIAFESFDTKIELDAFLKGVDATDGYLDASVELVDENGEFPPLEKGVREGLLAAGYSKEDLENNHGLGNCKGGIYGTYQQR